MQTSIKQQQMKEFHNVTLQAMYIFPAKKQYAVLHRNASRFSYKNLQNTTEPKEWSKLRCPCCDNFIFNQQFSLLQSTQPENPQVGKETFLLPPGVSMYFKFIKVVIYFLLLRFMIIDAYVIFIGEGGTYCSDIHSKGERDLCIFTESFVNLNTAMDQQKLVMVDYLSAVFTVVSIIFFLYFRSNMKKYYSWLDNCSEVSQENYSIFLENIPLPQQMSEDEQIASQDRYYKKLIKDEIMKKINDWFNKISKIIKKAQVQYSRGQKIEIDSKQNVSIIEGQLFSLIVNKGNQIKGETMEDLIQSITLCYDLNIYENFNKLRSIMTQKYIEEINKQIQPSERQWTDKENIRKKINKVNQSIVKMSQQHRKNNEIQFLGKAFVTFRYQPFRSFFLNEYRNNPHFLKISGNSIKISSANRPEEIYWNNLKMTDQERNQNLVHSYTILFLLLFVSLVLLLLMQLWQISQITLTYTSDATSLSNKLKSILVSLSMSLTTYIINFVLGYSIQRLANMQRHKANTYRAGSLIIKMVVSQTINTLAIYYILNMMRPFNMLGKFGLATRIVNLIFFTSAAEIFLSVIPFAKLKRIILNALLCRKEIEIFQIELNKLYEYPQFNFTQKYAFYIVFTYAISFYGLLVPAANILLILAFIILYWVDKYNLFRRSSITVEIDFFTIKASFAFLQFSLLIYIVGYIIWDLMVHFDSQYWLRGLNLLNLMVVMVYLALSYRFDYAGEADWSEEYCVNKNSFSKYVKLMDKRLYQSINPVTAYGNDKKDCSKQPYVRIQREFKRWQALHEGYFGHLMQTSEIKRVETKVKKWKVWLQQNNNKEGSSTYKQDDVVLFEECFQIKKIQLQKYLENMFKQGQK